MTVSTTTNRKDYIGNGTTDTFVYDFRIFEDTDLVVVKTTIATGVETILTLTTHYNVFGVGDDDGGTVVLVGGNLSSAYTLTIIRVVPITQETVYTEGDNFPAQSHEDALDRLTMISQQLDEKTGRTIQSAISSTLTGITLPVPDAGKAIGWNNTEDGLENVSTTVLPDEISTSGMDTAGYVKNTALGVLQGGQTIAAADLPAASDTAQGAAELATDAECLTGTDDERIVTPAGMKAAIDNRGFVTSVTSIFALLQNRQTQNTAGGTATSGSWLIVPLNTEQEDPDSIVDITALPAFTLAAGSYRITAYCPFFNVERYQTRLYDITNGTVIAYGPTGLMSNEDSQTGIPLIATFTLTGTTQLRLEYQIASTCATVGLGSPANFGPEVYAQVEITKTA